MIKQFLHAGLLVGALILAQGQADAPTDVPEKIKAPQNEKVVLRAHASGVQIYICQQGADGKGAWTLKAPEAELSDHGSVIGRHYAGPTWKHKDGSEVTGKAAARVDAPEDDSIPWLLITANGHSGNGVFSNVTTIQRIHTKGGQPPAGDCDNSKEKSEVKSRYTADYYFYAPAK